jgi:mitosis inhibitor protein kinase SWE1
LNRTASSSSDASTTTMIASPTGLRQTQLQPQTTCIQKQSLSRVNDVHNRRTSLISFGSSLETYVQPGKFEREFVEIGELGSGEFGKAMKVRRQGTSGTSGDITAVKKSKRFEGVRHR